MYQYPYQSYQPDPVLENYRQKAREAASLGMGQQFQNFQPNYQQYQPQTIVYTVSSLDEARAARIDNPMNTYIFRDTANNKIYTKSIGDNGAAVLQSYALEVPPPPTSEDRYAVLEKQIAELKAIIKPQTAKPEAESV